MRALFIPRVVAERAHIITGHAAVTRGGVYVGPGRHVIGWIFRMCGLQTIEC